MNFKKIMAILLACMTVLSLGAFALTLDVAESAAENVVSDEAVLAEETTVSVWDGTLSDAWLADGNPEGTSGDKFYLESAAELAGFAYWLNNYSSTNNLFVGDTVYLTVDVDLNNLEWTPIGTMSTDKRHFYGSFDGQNHIISNLKISEESNQIYGGLFGRFKGTSFSQTFSNLTIHNVDISTVASSDGKEGAGALMGYGYDQIIYNVHVTGKISINGNRCVGGLVGHSRANISNSSVKAEGNISGDSYRAGGLVGWFVSASGNGYNAEINDCTVEGTGTTGITIESAASYSGGLVGQVSNNNSTVVVDDVAVYNASVSADSGSVGYISSTFTATNTTVANVSASVAGETVTPSDGEDVTFAIAEVGGVYYTDIKAAFKAVTAENSVVNILENITIDYKWDCRNYGSTACNGKFTVPVTINGNGHTLKFTNKIDDGGNHYAAFRFEDVATVKNLTVDMSEAVSVFQNRFSAISTKTGNLTVENCTFIGSTVYTKARAIIFGEGGNSETLADTAVSVTGCTFTNWRYGVVDNMNGADVKSVTINNSEFSNASVQISAAEEVTITGNTLEDGFVKVSSYTQSAEQNLVVTVKDNELDADADNQIQAGTVIDVQDGFILPAAEVNGKKYMTIEAAVNAASEGATVYVAPGTYTVDKLSITKSITLTGAPKADTATLAAEAEKPVIVIKNVTNGGVQYHAPNVVFDNLKFVVASDATGETWNVSALGYYYEDVKNREGLTVTNCDFVNESSISMSAIAANIAKYTVTNNTFKNFTTMVHSFVDHGAVDAVVISGNKFEDVDYIANVYYGAPASDTASITITDNKSENGETAKIYVDDFGMTKADPKTAYKTVTLTGNDADVMFINQNSDFTLVNNNNGSTINSYTSETVMRAMDGKLPDGVVYVAYGTDEQQMFIVVEGYVKTEAETVELIFKPNTSDEDALENSVWDMYLVASNGEIINRLNSGDFTFVLDSANAMAYEIIASNSEVSVNNVAGDRYEFHYDGKTDVTTDTALEIKIATVKFTGYGTFTFGVKVDGVDTNAVHATTYVDNIVDSYTVGAGLIVNTDTDSDTDGVIESEIVVPTADLTIKVAFPNSVNNNVLAYQAMNVLVTGNDIADISIDLGTDNTGKALTADSKHDCKYTVAFDETACVYTVTIENILTLNTSYNVAVSGAGYRTARYTVTMTEDKELNFWNNVKDNDTVVEEGKYSEKKNFLAGDIVGDNNINIYDLSAVVSYFATKTNVEAASDYAKYDLNRDGVIDSKDVAYVLVSWGA